MLCLNENFQGFFGHYAVWTEGHIGDYVASNSRSVFHFIMLIGNSNALLN